MILTEHSICHYLAGKGLVDFAAVVAGNFSVRSRKSRNNNFIINKEWPGSSFFIKQASGLDADKSESIRREAFFYRLINTNDSFGLLRLYVPRFVMYDEIHHIVITKLIHDSVSVQQYYHSGNNTDGKIAAAIGKLLAAAHSCSLNETMVSENNFFVNQPPWVFSIAATAQHYLNNPVTGSSRQAMNIILGNKDFFRQVETVAKEWKPNGLVHGDCKLSNFLIEEEQVSVQLVDWELADYGDTAWDIGGVMQSYLLLWLIDDMLMQQMAVKKTELSMVQHSLNSFWNSYATGMNYTAAENKVMLEKCTRFGAMKLIHACFEMTHDAETLPPHCAKVLQMAFNIFKSPADAAERLMGIKMLQ